METNFETQPNSKRLSEIASDAKTVDQNSGFMDPGQKVKEKSKRGRKTNEEKARILAEQKAQALGKDKVSNPGPSQTTSSDPGPQIPTSQVVKPLVALISNMGVSYVGDPRAAMKIEELEAGAQALGLVADKYLPSVMNKYGPEVLCFMVFGQYGLRIMAMKKLFAIEKSNAENLGPETLQKVQNDEKEKVVEIFPQKTEKPENQSWEN